MNNILNKIKKKEITIGVIGLGYVGLPLALEFAKKKVKTIGFDLDESKIRKLNNGENYNSDLKSNEVKEVITNKYLSATINFSELTKCDVIFICVPTPFTVNKDPDISYILQAAKDIRNNLRKSQIIILKSTTFPGTTEKHIKPILEESGLKAGIDFYLAFSPERIDPGNKVWTTQNTPVVVGGIDENSTKLACEVIKLAVEKVVPVSSPSVAEMEKLLENIFRSVNIALVNELAQLCDRIGINIWDVVSAAATKPFGFMPFWPGPGIGGHCILIDPYYLSWMAREYDFETKFITLAAEINEDMPFYVTSMIVKEIAKLPKTIKNAKILILGMAFKKDVDDLRHSPALKVFEILLNEGFENINYYDPFIPEVSINGNTIKSIKAIDSEILKTYDVVCLTTDHTNFDYEMIAQNSNIIIDTRNAFKNVKKRDNIVLLGDGI